MSFTNEEIDTELNYLFKEDATFTQWKSMIQTCLSPKPTFSKDYQFKGFRVRLCFNVFICELLIIPTLEDYSENKINEYIKSFIMIVPDTW